MRAMWFLLACVFATSGLDAQGQRRSTGRGSGGSAALAIFVTDPAGVQVPNVLVTLEGATARSARTEGGRIAFEGLPPGSYRLRFEREGFVTLERELNARAGAPIDVKVTLRPAPAPAPPPPVPVIPEPQPAQVDARPATFDVPSVIEKEWVGRGPGKTTPLACGNEGNATLIQVKEPVPQHKHDEADEFIYVIAGEGSAQVAGRDQRVKAGVMVFVPRGVQHALTASGRNPLVVVSTKAGQGCPETK
jgi:mannose-6-phosphate isomerase-like protein (cupin superfamily)